MNWLECLADQVTRRTYIYTYIYNLHQFEEKNLFFILYANIMDLIGPCNTVHQKIYLHGSHIVVFRYGSGTNIFTHIRQEILTGTRPFVKSRRNNPGLYRQCFVAWRCYDMENFTTLLVLWERNAHDTDGFLSQRVSKSVLWCCI